MSYLKCFVFFSILTLSVFAGVDFNFPFVPPDLSSSGAQTPEGVTSSTDGMYVYVIWTQSVDNDVLMARSEDFGQTWSSPITVKSCVSAPITPQITTNASGEYVYAVWDVSDGTRFRAQTATSSDYGLSWHDPQSTPVDPTGGPNLSDPAYAAYESQIVTNAEGDRVYAVWYGQPGGFVVVQTAYSTNYGEDWVYPSSTPVSVGGADLSSLAAFASPPHITTDSSGNNVYAIWHLTIGADTIIQTARSINSGADWDDPVSTPAAAGTPNLSESGESANESQITTDSTGNNVYAIWSRGDVIQVAQSNNSGADWDYPVSTPPPSDTPNLSGIGTANVPQIAAGGTNVYATWLFNNHTIQVAKSSNSGLLWEYPDSTPTEDSPNLSSVDGIASAPQIATDDAGTLVYTVWGYDDGSPKIQAAVSLDGATRWVNPTSTPYTSPTLSEGGGIPQLTTTSTGENVYVVWLNSTVVQIINGITVIENLEVLYKKYMMQLLLQKDYVNELYWNSIEFAKQYKVYWGSFNAANVIYLGADLNYFHHDIFGPSTYYITWVDHEGVESDPPVEVYIP